MDQPIALPDLEDAINYWRTHSPSQGEEARLCPEAAALAKPYALMIISHRRDIAADDLSPEAREAYRQWRSARAG
ncbi:DUF3717 domain-containing protein [Bordetella genomosp. 13]|uniref:DUF3717 domain-containing protein n=1 Tax=Bordetella genomosp. 13 TaxID=463040 RepID=UPI0011A6BC7B|nr:DUF3717 domain-containing protein [Bordetella genomosp. 13]